MASNLDEKVITKGWAPDDGAPAEGTKEGQMRNEPAFSPQATNGRPATSPQPLAADPQHAPTGGGVTPPAAPGAAQEPVAPAASGQTSSTQVYTEAELNNRLAQQRAHFERQIERLQLRVEAIATGVPGAEVLLERIDRKAISYDETIRRPTNLKELLEAQRDILAQALGLAAAPQSAPGLPAPSTPQIPAILPTNGAQPVSSIKLTRAAIEAMTPAEVNAHWPAIQAALRAGGIK